MGHQPEVIPDDLPPHPSQKDSIDEDVTIQQLVSGDGIEPALVMRWSGYVNEYANELTPPPGLPTRFEDSTVEQVSNVCVSDCSTEEIVALLAWYFWHESGERDLFK